MGFLDSLLRQGARKIISEVADAAIDAVKDELPLNSLRRKGSTQTGSTAADSPQAGNTNGVSQRPQGASVPKREYPAVPAGYADVADETVDVKLRAVFAREFPQYEIRENVSPTTIGGTGRFRDYSFGVYENGEPKLFIMLVSGSDCAYRIYRWSKEQAERAGVPMINFVEFFVNRIDYIIDRLHQYL